MNSDFALALHCLLLLAYFDGEKLTSAQISKKLSVHPVRIRKILSTLRKKKYILSKEGAKGGFVINCNLKDVKLDTIYKLSVEDVLKPKCHTCTGECNIGKNIENVLDEIFNNADKNLQLFLKNISLEDVTKKIKKLS